MNISVQAAENLLKKVFHGVDYSSAWIPTKLFIGTMSPDECRLYLDQCPPGLYQPEKHECEDMAFGFKVDVHRVSSGEHDVGLAFIDNGDGKEGHLINFFFYGDAVFLVDVQTKEIRKAERGKDDNVYLVMI